MIHRWSDNDGLPARKRWVRKWAVASSAVRARKLKSTAGIWRVREARQPTLQDNQLLSKHRVLSFKPQLRLEWRGQDGQNETEQPDHSASLGDSITSSTQIRFSVHTGHFAPVATFD
jgi:hypothetical protein